MRNPLAENVRGRGSSSFCKFCEKHIHSQKYPDFRHHSKSGWQQIWNCLLAFVLVGLDAEESYELPYDTLPSHYICLPEHQAVEASLFGCGLADFKTR